MFKCSMQKKKESLSKKSESAPVVAGEFYSKFIEPCAREILEAYDMNDTQGGDGWEAHDVEVLNNTYSDGSPRDSFKAGLQKDFVGNLGFFESSGFHDSQLYYEIEKAIDAADMAYASDHGEVPERDSEGYDDYTEYVFDFLRDMNLWGVAAIEMYERSLRGVAYTLSASIGREYDGGDTIGNYLSVKMDLDYGQLTKENADKFIKAVEDAFANYSFNQGDKEINVKAD